MNDFVGVDFYWRPGCAACTMLRRGLVAAGLPLREIDISSDPDAAAFVRSVAGGAETVPTVVVADRAMVNPSTRDVVAVVARTAPHLLSRSGLRGIGYPLLAAVIWLLLAATRQDTTFHLGPALTTAAWAVTERFRYAAALSRGRATTTVAGGAAVTTAALTALYAAGGLTGPALFGGNALGESVIVMAVTALLTWWGVTVRWGTRG